MQMSLEYINYWVKAVCGYQQNRTAVSICRQRAYWGSVLRNTPLASCQEEASLDFIFMSLCPRHSSTSSKQRHNSSSTSRLVIRFSLFLLCFYIFYRQSKVMHMRKYAYKNPRHTQPLYNSNTELIFGHQFSTVYCVNLFYEHKYIIKLLRRIGDSRHFTVKSLQTTTPYSNRSLNWQKAYKYEHKQLINDIQELATAYILQKIITNYYAVLETLS